MIILDISHKGGVGKTTTVTTFGAGLAADGYNVLIIDSDPQGHVALSLNLNNDNPKEEGAPPEEIDGLYMWVSGQLKVEQCLYRVSESRIPLYRPAPQRGSLWVLPSSDNTRKLQYDFAGIRIKQFADKIMRLASAYDVVLIDTPPTIDPFRSSFDAALMVPADYILIPTLCERLSVDGLGFMAQREEFADLQYANTGKRAEVLGIIPTRWSNTQARNHNLNSLKADYGDLVWPRIRDLTTWERATAFFETVLTYDPESPAAAEAWQMVERLEALVCQKVLA